MFELMAIAEKKRALFDEAMRRLKEQRALNAELLALVKEARADWLRQWENLPNTLRDQEEADELDGLIKRADALIAKAAQ